MRRSPAVMAASSRVGSRPARDDLPLIRRVVQVEQMGASPRPGSHAQAGTRSLRPKARENTAGLR